MTNLLKKATTNPLKTVEVVSGLLLIVVTILALIIANSTIGDYYFLFLKTPLTLKFNEIINFNQPLLFWINDCLMVGFFFLIGLEIKKEFITGHLARPKQRILPIIATLGGIIAPAFIYFLFNFQFPNNLRGWAIPIATDIAFSLGILSLASHHIPKSLRILLMTIAVLDDLVAVCVIALFYAKDLSPLFLTLSLLLLTFLILLNWLQVKKISLYLFLSLILWVFVLNSGVHPTIAGILAALTIPYDSQNPERSPLARIEQKLKPWVIFGILPLFAFTNAGVSLKAFNYTELLQPLSLGIMLGLFLGKQLGIFLGSFLCIKLKWSTLPLKTTWKQIYGMSVLCGIGFTMSLFIGTLAFEEGTAAYEQIKLSVLLASFVACILGYSVLKFSKNYMGILKANAF